MNRRQKKKWSKWYLKDLLKYFKRHPKDRAVAEQYLIEKAQEQAQREKRSKGKEDDN